MFYYIQRGSSNETWQAVPAAQLQRELEKEPAMFRTALAVNKLIEGDVAQLGPLSYMGPLYIDFDNTDLDFCIEQVQKFLYMLEADGLDLTNVHLFASGGRGFHVEIPEACFMDKPPRLDKPKEAIQGLPMIYKEMVFQYVVDTIDLTVYSQKRGRMWRQPNVKRPNDCYKVPITLEELKSMNVDSYSKIVSQPREPIQRSQPVFCTKLAVAYSSAAQKVETALKEKAKRKPDPKARSKASSLSVRLLMQGEGVRADAGFQSIALQLSIVSKTLGLECQEFLTQCEGICRLHESDSNRYNSFEKRQKELARMWAYMQENDSYEFSANALRTLLNHDAPDLDGVPIGEEELKEAIDEGKLKEVSSSTGAPDEYADVAGGVTMSRFGVYVSTEHGKDRACAISFRNVHLLKSMESGKIVAYEAEVLVNGTSQGRHTLELDTFLSLSMFNRFAIGFSHALQGSESTVRGLMMRFAEEGKKKGKTLYIAKREGLDIVSIPQHEDEELRKPFMIWADARGVRPEPRIAAKNLEFSFQGHPDPRGKFQTDLADAPNLSEWIEEGDNRDMLKEVVENMIDCQKPDYIAKLLGFYCATPYRTLMHHAYGKFPLLHVVGSGGSGKSETTKAFAHFFTYNADPKILTPTSSLFAITEYMASSSSLPLILDEYKPWIMLAEVANKWRLMMRDAYNMRDVAKGGGTRENADYRSLTQTQLSAPLIVISEAAEEESALTERLIVATMVRPESIQNMRNKAMFDRFDRNKRCLSVIGKFIYGEALATMTVQGLQEKMDPMLAQARKDFMLTEEDLKNDKLSMDQRRDKASAKERNIFNYTVAQFGASQFFKVMKMIYGTHFDEREDKILKGVYSRFNDLQAATMPEWAKVMQAISSMTYNIEAGSNLAITKGRHYAFVEAMGTSMMEMGVAICYDNYRAQQRQISSTPLFGSSQAFEHAMRDCPALVKIGDGQALKQPRVYTFSVNKLIEMGVDPFKP